MKYSVKVVKTESTRHPHVKGDAPVILNDGIILKNIRIMDGRSEKEGLRMIMPSWINTNEKTHKTFLNSKFNPINNDFRLALYNAIVEAYESGNIVTKYTESGEDMPLTITVKRFDDPENIVKASAAIIVDNNLVINCLLYTSPSPRDFL